MSKLLALAGLQGDADSPAAEEAMRRWASNLQESLNLGLTPRPGDVILAGLRGEIVDGRRIPDSAMREGRSSPS